MGWTWIGFLGRNGAGKTTTIKILMNMLKPTAGAVEVLGQDPHVHEKELKERVGYISDNPVLYDWMKVEEVAWFAGQLYPRWDQQKVAALIEHFGLDPKQKIKHLSRGMNAQLNLALVLGHDPELLILDDAPRRARKHHPSHQRGRPDSVFLVAFGTRGRTSGRPGSHY
ncbi:MAG: ABC transporter ATP-binding protein [Candidatus Latescibacteria bacterium]|nr:ABC transporter ATP-binding protein [Candidatus Latescibacterota bacterium]